MKTLSKKYANNFDLEENERTEFICLQCYNLS